jgi:transposase
LSTKIHAAVDAWGHPVRCVVTQGQASEYDQAASLSAGFQADIVLADLGYDANRLIALIRVRGAVVVILARKHRLEGRAYAQAIDQERNLVERLFQTLKHYRSIATRDERLARNHIAMLLLVATIIWLE